MDIGEFQRRFNHAYDGIFQIQQGSDEQYRLFSVSSAGSTEELELSVSPGGKIGSTGLREVFDKVFEEKDGELPAAGAEIADFPFRGKLGDRWQYFKELLEAVDVIVDLQDGTLTLYTPLGEELGTMGVESSEPELEAGLVEQAMARSMATEAQGGVDVEGRLNGLPESSPVVSTDGIREALTYQQSRLSQARKLSAQAVESFMKEEFPDRVAVVEEDEESQGFTGLARTLHVFKEGRGSKEIPVYLPLGGAEEEYVDFRAAKVAIEAAKELGGDEKGESLKEKLFAYEGGEEHRREFERDYEGREDGERPADREGV